MTTIAYDGKTLAADSRMTSGNMVFSNSAEKIFELKDGSLLALCGDFSLYGEVIDWFNGGDMPVVKEGEEIGGIHVFPDGVAEEFGRNLRLMPAKAPWAGGSGEPYAMTALMLGCSAAEAVKVACQLDTRSGLPVQQYRVATGG